MESGNVIVVLACRLPERMLEHRAVYTEGLGSRLVRSCPDLVGCQTRRRRVSATFSSDPCDLFPTSGGMGRKVRGSRMC